MNIDEALREYVGREPPLGMEGRILRRRRRRGVGWRVWIWGLAPVGLALGLVFWVGLRPEVVLPVRPIERAPVMEDAGQKPGGRAEALPHKRRESSVEALWRFAQAHPAAARSLAEFPEPEPLTALQTAPIETAPITIDELGDSKR